MSEKVSSYDFHGLVSMQVIDRERGGLPGFALLTDPFPYFRVDSLSNDSDIILELGEFEPRIRDCYLVDHKYHVRRNYLYCEDSWRAFRWRVEIEGFESGPTTIRLAMRGGGIRPALVPGLYSRMLLSRQLLAQKLCVQGCSLAHAAGAARDGRAVLLFGRGGSYKTTVLMDLLKSSPDWRLLGDDGVILKGNQAMSFPTYPGLFAYRLAHKEREHLTAFDRFRLLLNAPSDEAVRERYASTVEIAALVEMRAGAVGKLCIEEVSATQNVSTMHTGIRLEEHNSVNMGFNDKYPLYVEAYSYIFPRNELKTLGESELDLAGKVSCRIDLPASPTQEDVDQVIDFLNSKIA